MEVMLVECESGDWIGMYVDGKLKEEGHSLRPTDVLDALGVKWRCETISDEQMQRGLSKDWCNP